jgi:hypothetical protein
MSAATSARALTAQLGAGAIPAGIQYPVADNVVCLAGTIAVSNGSGYCLSAPSGSGYVALGRFQATVDNTSAGPAGAGHANGALYAGVDQGVFCWNNSTAGDAITNANRGSVCYIADNQTVALTDGGGTRSIAGIIVGVAPATGPVGSSTYYAGQVFVQMGIWVQTVASNLAGALTSAGIQTVTGAKTFADSTLIVQNSTATATTTLNSAATSNRTTSLPDIASGTILVDAGTQTITGVKTFASSADPVFAKEANHTVNVVTSTTATTAGGNLTVAAGAGATSGAGGVFSGAGGAGGATGAGGASGIVGGAGGATSGTGGAATVTGGAGTNGNATGGAASVTGGAGQGSAAGGASSLVGGVGGATGAGGAIAVTGGAGGATSGTGGAIVIAGGAGSGGNANGGAVTIRGGAKNGSGADGALSIGATNTASIALGAAGISTTWTGSLIAAAAGLFGIGTAQALSGAGAVDVTHIVTLFTSTGGAQALTLADGTVNGQIKFVHHTVDGGSGVLTPTTAGNFSTATFTNVHEWALFMWSGTAWNVIAASPISIIA